MLGSANYREFDEPCTKEKNSPKDLIYAAATTKHLCTDDAVVNNSFMN